MGINVAAVYIGLSAGPFLGGFLTQHFGWRSIFYFTMPLGLVVIWLVKWKLKGEWADAKGEAFDVVGAVLYGVSIVTVMYGVSLLPKATSAAVVLLGLLGLAAFVVWERRAKPPVFDIRLFTDNRIFAFSCAAALIHYGATFAVAFFMSLYLQNVKGLSPQGAGLVLIAQPVVMAMLSPFAGRLSDRLEPRIVASIGMALTASSLFLFTFLKLDSSLGYILCTLVILGVGFALFSSPNTNAIMSAVDRRFYGIASGSVGTMRLLGMMISMGVASVIFSLMLGKVRITPEHFPAFIRSVRVAFWIFTSLCTLGTFASLVRGRVR